MFGKLFMVRHFQSDNEYGSDSDLTEGLNTLRDDDLNIADQGSKVCATVQESNDGDQSLLMSLNET